MISALKKLDLWHTQTGSVQTQPKIDYEAAKQALELWRLIQAEKIWKESVDVIGTPAETYLLSRGLDPSDLNLAIRFHPRCPWGHGEHPCMISLLTDAITGKRRGIHRTAISDGKKVKVYEVDGPGTDRKILGTFSGSVIRLAPDSAVTTGLVIGEGIETVLSGKSQEHNGSMLWPGWATGDDHNLKHFPVLPGIECLTIITDNDPSSVGANEVDPIGGTTWVIS